MCVCWQLSVLSLTAESPRPPGHAGVLPQQLTQQLSLSLYIQTHTLILTDIVLLKQELCLAGRRSTAFLDFDKSHSWSDRPRGYISHTCTRQSSALLDREVHFNLMWFACTILTDETKHGRYRRSPEWFMLSLICFFSKLKKKMHHKLEPGLNELLRRLFNYFHI